MTAALTWTAAKVSVPILVRAALDRGVVPQDFDALRFWVLVLVGVGCVQAVATGSRRYCAFRLALRSEANLRRRLFAHLQSLHFSFHDSTQIGQLMARGNTDMQQIRMVLVMTPITTANFLTVASVTGILLATNVLLAVLALSTLPLLNVAAVRFSNKLHPKVLGLQERLGDVSGVVEETVSGVRVVKGFGAEGLQRGGNDRAAENVRGVALEAARLRANFIPLLDALPMIGLVAILWFGGHQVLAGNLTAGEIAQSFIYILMLVWPLRMLGQIVAQLSRATASASRIHEVLDTAPEIVDRPGADPLPSGRGDVRFEGVRFTYETGPRVLDGLDLHIRPGESVALVGPTGCGKSTVARLIPRFYDVDDGRVLLEGRDVRELRLEDVRKAVGIVFEDTFLFSDTVRSNIAFADPDAPFEQVERAARLAGAHEFVEAMPKGYETVLGEHGFSLSGGQRQRVAIARAILADPRVLILDDATSSVDPTKEHEIREALEEVMSGRTTIIIGHRPATIALADRVLLLDQGQIVDRGSHDELLGRSEAYRRVLAQASQDDEEPAPIAGGEARR